MSTAKKIALILFSSRTCSLCTTAKDTLLRVQQEIPFELKVLDIHKSECPKEFADRYMFDIPVVHLNDEFLVQHRISQDKLVDALKKYETTGKVEKI
ncbi:thioredoxin-like protein [Chlamydoabsidia padenii]|nr:thioredoxin-like protein [Chlamydoabsidia padenii]